MPHFPARRSILLLLIACFTFATLPAQDAAKYHHYYFLSYAALYNKAPQEAYLYADSALLYNPGDLSFLLTVAGNMPADMWEEADELYLKAFGRGLSWADYRKILQREDRKESLDKQTAQQQMRAFQRGVRPEINKELEGLVRDDQRCRERDQDCDAIDENNFRVLVELFADYGEDLFTYDVLGTNGADNLDLLLLHFGENPMTYFMPQMVKAVREGRMYNNANPAYEIDRISLTSGKLFYVDTSFNLLQYQIGELPCLFCFPGQEAYFSSTGTYYELARDDRTLYTWPIYAGDGVFAERMNKTRELLLLPALDNARVRNPRSVTLSVREFREKFRFLWE